MATRGFYDKLEAAQAEQGLEKTEAFRAIPLSYWQTAPLDEAATALQEARDEILEHFGKRARLYVTRTEGEDAGRAYYMLLVAHYDKLKRLLKRRSESPGHAGSAKAVDVSWSHDADDTEEWRAVTPDGYTLIVLRFFYSKNQVTAFIETPDGARVNIGDFPNEKIAKEALIEEYSDILRHTNPRRRRRTR